MAQDMKYGQVTLEKGHVGEEEPVVVFRARDVNLPRLLSIYHGLCVEAGSSQFHLDLIDKRHDEIEHWQQTHRDQVRVPQSAGYHAAQQETA